MSPTIDLAPLIEARDKATARFEAAVASLDRIGDVVRDLDAELRRHAEEGLDRVIAIEADLALTVRPLVEDSTPPAPRATPTARPPKPRPAAPATSSGSTRKAATPPSRKTPPAGKPPSKAEQALKALLPLLPSEGTGEVRVGELRRKPALEGFSLTLVDRAVALGVERGLIAHNGKTRGGRRYWRGDGKAPDPPPATAPAAIGPEGSLDGRILVTLSYGAYTAGELASRLAAGRDDVDAALERLDDEDELVRAGVRNGERVYAAANPVAP